MFHFGTFKKLFLGIILVLSVFSFACMAGRAKPLLYPNKHLQEVGQAQANSDIAYCESLAEQYIQQHPDAAGKIIGNTAVGGGAGAAVGAIGGAIAGSPGEGAGIGAGVGAGLGLLRGLYKAGEVSPNYEQFVNRCLSKRGYEVYGWDN